MTRMEDMIKRYGECVTVAAAARIMGRSRQTVKRMIDDGRMRWACAGTMVDVRSMAEYIESPAQADRRARAAQNSNFGRSRFSV